MSSADQGSVCRACGSGDLHRVLDLGRQPAADHFPLASSRVTEAESGHPLAMDLCGTCGLAQLAEDDTVADEPRGVEPQALKDQAADAVSRVDAAGLLGGEARGGRTVREFPSPHGGTWIPLLAARGYVEVAGPADVVIDSMGIMHEPDQRSAFAERAAVLADGGLLLLQYHSLAAILRQGQWNALRHGHFAYYSLHSLLRLLESAGLRAVQAWEFELYGGSVLVAARHVGSATATAADGGPAVAAHLCGPGIEDVLAAESAAGVTDPAALGELGRHARDQAIALRSWAAANTAAGYGVYAYGAASRAVPLFALAGLDRATLRAVADASPAKLGLRMPGTDIPIVSPEALVGMRPDRVLLTVPDLYDEVLQRYPSLEGALTIDPEKGVRHA
ncbi:class I SAM-dependent methyltransferase [Tsukamurella sp. 8F]|uniref:class I SAM-dependent methyltransferase n=1 Tax=unclassified Tsukamurella TaxID=2633480 RepID=UPI0023B99178|nr:MULTISPECIES: class I SAM-dependent methyltransferase [unclassified Tsukamurella]MDF0530664.1 class I SAM-dependent methyltransferase [Tsukamurella sp. 8J]MDF0587865.1 class I SAM-dependent methyltransferase [Tsukamurella sp. 8F]